VEYVLDASFTFEAVDVLHGWIVSTERVKCDAELT
jgi:hypothetical protein